MRTTVQIERERFERWARSHGLMLFREEQYSRGNHRLLWLGDYLYPNTRASWREWLEREGIPLETPGAISEDVPAPAEYWED